MNRRQELLDDIFSSVDARDKVERLIVESERESKRLRDELTMVKEDLARHRDDAARHSRECIEYRARIDSLEQRLRNAERPIQPTPEPKEIMFPVERVNKKFISQIAACRDLAPMTFSMVKSALISSAMLSGDMCLLKIVSEFSKTSLQHCMALGFDPWLFWSYVSGDTRPQYKIWRKIWWTIDGIPIKRINLAMTDDCKKDIAGSQDAAHRIVKLIVDGEWEVTNEGFKRRKQC